MNVVHSRPRSPSSRSPRLVGLSLLAAALIAMLTLGGALGIGRASAADAESELQSARAALRNGNPLKALSESFRTVARAVEPSVVHIEVRGRAPRLALRRNLPDDFQLPPGLPESIRRFFDIPELQPDEDEDEDEDTRSFDVPRVMGNGSGWVYDSAGHIITNHHVVEHADQLIVRFHDGSEAQATVVGTDPDTEIAVIKVDPDRVRLHPAEVAEQPVEQGDIVFAFGSPLRFEFSMSQGIVSGMGREMGIIRRGNARGYENFIQTDAAINPGNSGGPLVDAEGRVVGMNTAIATRSGFFSGVGFAIPARMIQSVAEQLIDTGRVRRAYLGVYIQDDPRLLESFGFDGRGVLISDAQPGGPGDEGGLKSGDIVIALDGQPVSDASEFRRTISLMTPGTEVTLRIWRDGRERDIDVELGELPAELTVAGAADDDEPRAARAASTAPTLRKLGLDSVSRVTRTVADRLGVEPGRGVAIRAVRPGSAAEAAGIEPGMVITAVGNNEVTTPDELEEQLSEADLAAGARLKLIRDGRTFYTVISLEE